MIVRKGNSRSASKIAFTLIEMMMVVVIVGILAAVAVPMMSSMRKHAVISEAYAGCSAIVSHLRVFEVEGNAPASGNVTAVANGVMSADLKGNYFPADCYSLNFTDFDNWKITVDGTKITDVNNPAKGIVVTLDQAGDKVVTLQ